jgi:hypothetical protein
VRRKFFDEFAQSKNFSPLDAENLTEKFLKLYDSYLISNAVEGNS